MNTFILEVFASTYLLLLNSAYIRILLSTDAVFWFTPQYFCCLVMLLIEAASVDDFSPSVMGKESVLIASRAIRSFPSLDPLRLCFSLRRKNDLLAAADRVLLVPLSSFMSAMQCLL